MVSSYVSEYQGWKYYFCVVSTQVSGWLGRLLPKYVFFWFFAPVVKLMLLTLTLMAVLNRLNLTFDFSLVHFWLGMPYQITVNHSVKNDHLQK